MTVTKVWVDESNRDKARPTAAEYAKKVHLYADGVKQNATPAVTANGGNTYTVTFADLPVNRKGKVSQAITYTVKEDAIEGYTVSPASGEVKASGKLTNTHTVIPAPVRFDPPVKKRITGDKPSEATVFKFVFKAVKGPEGMSAVKMPMPAGASRGVKRASVKGGGSVEFGVIEFTKPGVYVYECTEEKGSAEGYTWDDAVFRIVGTITEVDHKLKGKWQITRNGVAVKGTKIEFVNRYTKPAKPEPVRPEPVKPEPVKPEPVKPDFTLLASINDCGHRTLTVRWTEVQGADGYEICLTGPNLKLIGQMPATETGSNARAYKFTKLRSGMVYKISVRAWKWVKGKKQYIGKASPAVYSITGGTTKQKCNPRSITLNKTRVSLTVGKTVKLKATVKGMMENRALLSQPGKVRWYSGNRNVASVNGSGVVKGVSKGSCTICAITANGLTAKAKVKVSPKPENKK